MNETTINGVDVSECAYFNSTTYEEPYCNIDQERLYTCSSDENCYFKQLKRLEQQIEACQLSENEAKEIIAELEYKNERLQEENEELKEKNKSIAKDYINVFGDYQKHKQALEEIRETILNYESKEWNCFNDMDAKLEKISEILDEVLNERD